MRQLNEYYGKYPRRRSIDEIHERMPIKKGELDPEQRSTHEAIVRRLLRTEIATSEELIAKVPKVSPNQDEHEQLTRRAIADLRDAGVIQHLPQLEKWYINTTMRRALTKK